MSSVFIAKDSKEFELVDCGVNYKSECEYGNENKSKACLTFLGSIRSILAVLPKHWQITHDYNLNSIEKVSYDVP